MTHSELGITIAPVEIGKSNLNAEMYTKALRAQGFSEDAINLKVAKLLRNQERKAKRTESALTSNDLVPKYLNILRDSYHAPEGIIEKERERLKGKIDLIKENKADPIARQNAITSLGMVREITRFVSNRGVIFPPAAKMG